MALIHFSKNVSFLWERWGNYGILLQLPSNISFSREKWTQVNKLFSQRWQKTSQEKIQNYLFKIFARNCQRDSERGDPANVPEERDATNAVGFILSLFRPI